MIIKKTSIGVYASNVYLVGCEETKEAILIDAGGDSEKIINWIEESSLKVRYIILTHGHGDHINALPAIKKALNIPLLVSKEDKPMVEDAEINLSSLMNIGNIEMTPDQVLGDGDVIEFGTLKAEIIHTPGHTKGSISIKIEDNIFSGDTLFAGSIGRTDLPGGSFDEIIHSIKTKLLDHDDETKVYPGHGEATTIGIERKTNPFIK